MGYDYLTIEKKWQEYWEKNNTFYCDVYDFSKPPFYALDMFPYPSGAGLHVGHPRGYTATDIVSRMKRMQGYNVLHPMGWDAFGLPAEQYAINTGNHPDGFTRVNIANFKRQIKMLGFSYDWSKEIATCDQEYYHFTQWIFIQFFKRGLAVSKEIPVNYCPELGTVLANEEVIDGKSERGGFPVIRKPMRQWLLLITKYAERLLDDLSLLDWPSSTIEMQKNWIGKSEGVEIFFRLKDMDDSFSVFTTRVDTLYGCTYCVLAPEHPLIKKIVTEEYKTQIEDYIKACESKSDLERTSLNKEKTGVFTGSYAINPINQKEVPIYIGDYVLGNYGSGAVMAVPAHDQRDYEFAKKHNLPIIQVLEGDISTAAMEDDGKHINSPLINGLMIKEAKEIITQELESKNNGTRKINFKLRDWLFSRQRYWGEPIPLIELKDHQFVPVKEEELPLVLPDLDDFKPSKSVESPLAKATDWLKVDINGQEGRRETNTMPQWAGSCWYYLRYLDPHNTKEIADPELIKHWIPVNLYIGGAEHAVLHLLYARFYHKFLYDLGITKSKEPFKKLFHQGMILGSNGEKMSKSRGNVINPDDVVKNYGADSLRLYEMFIGPLEASLPWSETGLDGAKRFLDRVYRLYSDINFTSKFCDTNNHKLDYVYNYTVKKVTEDFENLQFNTAISQMMIFINEAYKADKLYRPYLENFVKMFACVAPHLGEEIWSLLGHGDGITYQTWPTYNPELLVLKNVDIAIQICGKLRDVISMPNDSSEEEIKAAALAKPSIASRLEGKEIKKIIVIKNKIINIVAI